MDDVRDQINQRPDALFAGAEAARTAELYRALRDPVCWVEQLAVVLIMGMKCVALALVSRVLGSWQAPTNSNRSSLELW